MFSKANLFGVLAVLIFASATYAAEPLETASARSKPTDWETLDPTPAGAADLVVGDGYMLEVKRDGVTKKFCGDLIQGNDEWLVLRSTSVRRQSEEIPVLGEVFLVGSVFRSEHDAVEQDDVWIRRGAATLVSHLAVAKPVAVKPEPPAAPPLKKHCSVEISLDGKSFNSLGELTSLGEKIAHFETTAGSESVVWRNVLCIAFPVSAAGNPTAAKTDTAVQQ